MVGATALLALISDPPGPVLCCLGRQSMTRSTMLFSNLSPAGLNRNTDRNTKLPIPYINKIDHLAFVDK